MSVFPKDTIKVLSFFYLFYDTLTQNSYRILESH